MIVSWAYWGSGISLGDTVTLKIKQEEVNILGAQNSHFSLCLGRESLDLPRIRGNTFAQQECTVLKLVLSVGEEGRI